jgi:hypothetical protein
MNVDPMQIPPFVPLQPPPPGVTSNFTDRDMTRYNRVVATIASTLTIALIFVLTRLWTRAFMVRHFGRDDGEHLRQSFSLLGRLTDMGLIAMCLFATALTIAFNVVMLQREFCSSPPPSHPRPARPPNRACTEIPQN